MDIIKWISWISSNGYHEWISSKGYHKKLTSHTNTKNKTTGSFLGYLDAERASE
jgi:hypothetical protein